ncbi:MAG: efflux RND transporter periplasmic adaptor subunit [Chitinispirillaceae bacterium]|nr:efflux RND transporter periplasmic adaptor subunit [Chitinispirillaceae bacterium]
MKKKILLSIGLLFVLLLVWRVGALIFFSKNKNTARPKRPPVAVEVDSVRFGPLSEIRSLTGTINPKYLYIIAPKVSGRIVAITKRIGDWVNAGEIIARIDDAEYQQGVIEADANLKIAEASRTESRILFEQAKQEKQREESLQAKGIASPSELDAAVSNYSAQESRYQLAKAQVEQRQAALNAARIRLSYTRLTASKKGFIGERFADEGALLAPNSPVVSVIGIDSVIVKTFIVERDYAYITTGQQATVTVDAFPSQRFTGIVSRVAPMLQENSRLARMEVEIANDSLFLKPGMFVRIEVVIAEKETAQKVPSKAIVNNKGVIGVFIVSGDEHVARFFPVTTGIVTPSYTEILSPQLTGLLVTLGQHLLDDGSPVILPKGSTDIPDRASAVKDKEKKQ